MKPCYASTVFQSLRFERKTVMFFAVNFALINFVDVQRGEPEAVYRDGPREAGQRQAL